MRKLPLLSMLLLSACMVGPDYKMPSFELPDSWTKDAPKDAPAAAVEETKQDWWKIFNDATLTSLEDEGIAANGDLALAAARVSEARALLSVSEADLYPSLSGEASANRQGASKESFTGSLSRGKPYSTYSLSAVLNYEIDLWGRIRRANEAARAQLLSEKANRDAVRLAVASDIATTYFTIRALDSQIAITQNTIKSRQGSFDYQQKQYNAGAVDILTLRRAEAELAVAEGALPVLQQSRVEQQSALSVLLGRSPKAIVEAPLPTQKHIAELPVPPVMPKDTPSTLLQRRPDISMAEQQLIAANANIGVARADYYPTLSLTALLGLASLDVDRLLRTSARAWSATGTSTVPIVDFGRVSGNVDAAEARKDQALANYQQVVRKAFGDVVNAMSQIKTADAQVKAQTRQVKANQETLRVAGLRFDAGYATQLDLLDAQRQFFQAQLDQVSAMQGRLAAVVTLQKALGGGWNAATPDATDKKPETTEKK